MKCQTLHCFTSQLILQYPISFTATLKHISAHTMENEEMCLFLFTTLEKAKASQVGDTVTDTGVPARGLPLLHTLKYH